MNMVADNASASKYPHRPPSTQGRGPRHPEDKRRNRIAHRARTNALNPTKRSASKLMRIFTDTIPTTPIRKKVYPGNRNSSEIKPHFSKQQQQRNSENGTRIADRIHPQIGSHQIGLSIENPRDRKGDSPPYSTENDSYPKGAPHGP